MHTLRHLAHRALIATGAVLAIALPPSGEAVPVSYEIQFVVDSVSGETDPGDCSTGSPNGPGGFNCSIGVGDTYFGEFTIDDALLGNDGENLAGFVFSFFIEIAGIVWDYLLPYPDSAFYGFRGPDGLGSESPGFDVQGGEVVNLRGGVYGSGDVPYVDFYPYGGFGDPHRFAAGDGRTWAYGAMLIARIPEPPTWLLVMIALVPFSLARMRQIGNSRSRHR
jgi:hypothetical protein